MPPSGVEDPFLYLDDDEVFHAIFHNQIEYDDERLCGAHAFSADGVSWEFGGTAWGNRVEFLGGSSVASYAFSRRERPHFVFGDPRAPRRITALTTGVQYGPGSPLARPGEDACYTLLQPVVTA